MIASVLRLAAKSLINRSLSVGLTVLSVALAVTLFLGVEKIRSGTRDSFNSTISETDLIVGGRSGSINLLLYSVFRLGDPTASMSWESYERLAATPGVAWTIPISLGDAHRGYRVVGTTPAYFEHFSYGRERNLDFAQGVPFDGAHDAVLGAEVARALDYELGDEITLSHGIGEVSFAEHDGHGFIVTGILAPTGTPVDRSVHVSLAGIEAIHEGWETGAPPSGNSGSEEEDHDDAGEHDEHDEAHVEPELITAVFVGLDSPIQVLSLQRQINTYEGEALSAVMPGVALSQLWSVIAVGETAFLAISVFVIAVGLVSILTSLSSSLNERRREMAILRTIGARPGHVFTLLTSEAAGIALVGSLAGVALVNTLLVFVSQAVETRYGLVLGTAGAGTLDALTVVAVTLAGAFMGALPAWRALRRALTDGLSIKL